MTRWVLTFAALGLVACGISYSILWISWDFHDPSFGLKLRMLATLVWPTALMMLANEGATTSLEVVANFAKAIGLNVVLYAICGALLYGFTTTARKVFARGRA